MTAELLTIQYACLQRMAMLSEKHCSKLNDEDRKRAINECWSCRYRRQDPFNAHISCVKPDVDMVGNKHGIMKGWFMYPLLFDPVWKEKLCSNYEPEKAVNRAVSGVVNQTERAHTS